MTAVRPLYTYTFFLHLQNTHATDVRILVYPFPPVAKDGCQNLAPAQIGVNGPIEVCN